MVYQQLKLLKTNIEHPIIMVTKNEEEWLMEEAIGEHIDYLTKPVNPSQILIACKKVFENKSIQSNKALKDFINFFNTFDDLI